MILLTNGCSWTWGGSLGLEHPSQKEERESKVWPTYLGQHLGANKVIHLAEGCGSNQRIVRTTFDYLTLNKHTEEILAVIQWTEFSRFEYYVTDDPNNDFRNFSKNWALAKIDCLLSPEKDIPDALNRNNLRLSTYTKIEAVYSIIRDCLALAHLFQTYNIKYFYWLQSPLMIKNFPSNYVKYLDETFTFLNLHDNVWPYDRISEADAHPSFLGHEQLGEILHNKIKRRW